MCFVFLRRIIKAAQKEAPSLPWPPLSGSELKDWDLPPEQLSIFLSVLIDGKKMDKHLADSKRKVTPIGRYIVYAVP